MGPSLLSSMARIQAPWVKVTIGDYTFGVFSKTVSEKDSDGFYKAFKVQYPNFIQSLTINKINGQVNQYTLNITYPIRVGDDPNFFEKVFSSASNSRRIIFSYGDSMMPTYCYKDEEAIITSVNQSFNLRSSSISYTVSAVSSAMLAYSGSNTYIKQGVVKPSDEIKNLFKNPDTGLAGIFTGMNLGNLDALIAGDDKQVVINPAANISPLEYVQYLVSCMVPAGSTTENTSKDIYILTIHDDTIYDKNFADTVVESGPYFKVSKTSQGQNHAEAYEVDIGYNSSTIVSEFGMHQTNNYSILYEYQSELHPEEYIQKIDFNGDVVDVYAPLATSTNSYNETRAADTTWYTKMTKYPIKATLKIQGLLRPAMLMQYVRLNVVFPGGRAHTSSGLYIITRQTDYIGMSGYTTTLELTRIDE